MTKNKNNGKVTGLKKSGHKINSVEIPIIAPVNDQEHEESHSEGSNATLTDDCNIYLKELVEDYVESSSVIIYKETQVIVGSELSDIFIDPKFEIAILKKYFDEDAWLLVMETYNSKVESSKCGKCKLVCYEPQSIFCEKWFHWKCETVVNFIPSFSKTLDLVNLV